MCAPIPAPRRCFPRAPSGAGARALLRDTGGPAAVALGASPVVVSADEVAASGQDTVFDKARVLTGAEEAEVQETLDEASARTGEPLYVFFLPDEDVPAGEGRRDLLRAEAEGAPDEAGVIVVAPNDDWALVGPEVENAQGVFEAMRPALQDRSYAELALTGAERISDDASVAPEVAGFGAGTALLVAVIGGTLLARRRLRRRRELARARRKAEDSFGPLRERMADFSEKERLVAGYLDAQRALVDPGAQTEAGRHLNDANGAPFGAEFTDASSLPAPDPERALEKISEGNGLLDAALRSLDRAEKVLDDGRKTPKTRRAEED